MSIPPASRPAASQPSCSVRPGPPSGATGSGRADPSAPAAQSPEGADDASAQAFESLLDQADLDLHEIYQDLAEVAAQLEATPLASPDPLTDLGRDLGLSEIRMAVLSAQHAVHGALIGVVKARPQTHPWRPR